LCDGDGRGAGIGEAWIDAVCGGGVEGEVGCRRGMRGVAVEPGVERAGDRNGDDDGDEFVSQGDG
jgi:hypothetical protein